MPSQSEAESS
jgi:hypothetical protein